VQSAVGLSLFAITSAGWIAAHSPQADVHSPHWPAHTNRWFRILSVMEKRRVDNDHTVPWRGVKWQIPREAIQRGMRGSTLRIEQRLDGSIMARVQAEGETSAAHTPVEPAIPTGAGPKPMDGPVSGEGQRGVARLSRRTIQNADSAWNQELTFSPDKLAFGSKEFDPPFPFPQGQAGAGMHTLARSGSF